MSLGILFSFTPSATGGLLSLEVISAVAVAKG